jgi:hypothetical protein
MLAWIVQSHPQLPLQNQERDKRQSKSLGVDCAACFVDLVACRNESMQGAKAPLFTVRALTDQRKRKRICQNPANC